MKYESTILKRLIDTYGVVGNPRYISEIIKEFIVRGKECFPNLFTYQSDWLAHIDEFGLNPSYTVSYTGQSIYAPNTLERPVKSAILKGCTLVNVFPTKNATYSSSTTGQVRLLQAVQLIKSISINGKAIFLYNNNFPHSSQNGFVQLYTIKDGNRAWMGAVNYSGKTNGKNYIIIDNTYDSEITHIDFYVSNGIEGDYSLNNMMVVEYQDGIENWDIPYFEGMQSVKMPVLTTTGKNLFGLCEFEKGTVGGFPNTNVTITNNSISLGELGASVVIKFKGKPNTKYTISFTVNNTSTMNLREWNNRTQTTDVNGEVRWIYGSYNPNTNNGLYKLENIQLEEGSTATPYEPYKSNILRTSEDVVLKGIGDVQDTLNCNTGEYVEHIGEVMLDGVNQSYDSYGIHSANSNLRYIVGRVSNPCKFTGNYDRNTCVSDKISTDYGYAHLTDSDWGEGIALNGRHFKLVINLDRLSEDNLGGVKTYLSQNPITIQYELATPVVKTVDLTILDQNGQSVDHLKSFNGGTHVYTSSLEGSLVPSVDISVVTNLEETLKICSLEGNTM